MRAPPDPGAVEWEPRPRYRTLFASLREVVEGAGSLRELLTNARSLMHALVDAERVNLFAADPRNTSLWTLARSGGDTSQRLPRTCETIPGFVAITRRTVMVRNAYDVAELRALHGDLRHDPARDAGAAGKTRQVLATPVVGERAVVGVLEFVNSLDGNDFRPDDARLAEEVARLLGPAIEQHLSAQTARPETARFGMLIAQKLVSERQVDEAIARARSTDGDVPAVLMELHRVPRDVLGQSLADWHHLRFFAWDGRYRMARSLLERLSASFMRARVCAPVALTPDGTLLFVMESPDDIELVDAVRARRLAARVELLVGLRRDILAYIDASVAAPASSGVFVPPPLLALHDEGASMRAPSAQSQRPTAADGDAVQSLIQALDDRASTVQDPDDTGDDMTDSGEPEAIVARLVRHMVLDAASRGASDVHIEPNGDQGPCRVRMRIDGDCVDYVAVPAVHRFALVQRLKLLAELDISERRRPQDGKLRVRGPGGAVEVRIATLPTVGGDEDVVLRLLSSWRPMPLDDLAFAPRNLTAVREMIAQPYGIVLVVGPTGSGKTTTLHAALAQLNTPDMKVLTVEDPVEIVQPGLRQVQVNTRIGVGFAEVLRAFLRADPDVIMVGEMRDRVTAAVAIEASLTGHLVLSTLQANSAPETLTRLIGMDIDTMSLADALRGVVAQRLVRKLCDDCKAPYTPTPEEWHRLGDAYGVEAFASMMNERGTPPATQRAIGCAKCRGTGYRGRIALHEVLIGTEHVKELIGRRAPLEEIRAVVEGDGMRTMLQDGIAKVLDGVTDYRQVRAACVT